MSDINSYKTETWGREQAFRYAEILNERFKEIAIGPVFSNDEIVDDMEGQACRLIDFCGLAWDNACLDFHKNTYNVRTAIMTQIRQPIYTSTVQSWRHHYEKFLGPLLEVLGKNGCI